MAHTQKTLALNENWDFTLTPEGNLALLEGDAAILQNAANECRLWLRDAYFQQENGINWGEVALAQKMNISIVQQAVTAQCQNVDGVVSVEDVEITGMDEDRVMHGLISVRTINQTVATIEF